MGEYAKCYAKDFDHSTTVVENCKYMQELGKNQDMTLEIIKLKNTITLLENLLRETQKKTPDYVWAEKRDILLNT